MVLSPAGPVVIIVSLPGQRIYVDRNGVRIGVSTVSTGTKSHRLRRVYSLFCRRRSLTKRTSAKEHGWPTCNALGGPGRSETVRTRRADRRAAIVSERRMRTRVAIIAGFAASLCAYACDLPQISPKAPTSAGPVCEGRAGFPCQHCVIQCQMGSVAVCTDGQSNSAGTSCLAQPTCACH